MQQYVPRQWWNLQNHQHILLTSGEGLLHVNMSSYCRRNAESIEEIYWEIVKHPDFVFVIVGLYCIILFNKEHIVHPDPDILPSTTNGWKWFWMKDSQLIPEDKCSLNVITFVLQLRKSIGKNFNQEIDPMRNCTWANIWEIKSLSLNHKLIVISIPVIIKICSLRFTFLS